MNDKIFTGYAKDDLVNVINPDKYDCVDALYKILRITGNDADVIMKGDNRGGAVKSVPLKNLTPSKDQLIL